MYGTMTLDYIMNVFYNNQKSSKNKNEVKTTKSVPGIDVSYIYGFNHITLLQSH